MHPTNFLFATILATGIGVAGAAAQGTEHEQHQSGAAAETTSPAAPPATDPSQGTGPGEADQGMMMCRPPGMKRPHGTGLPMMSKCMEMMKNMDMMGGGAPGGMAAAASDDPVAAAFAAINQRMHGAMAVVAGVKPDVAFAQAMIPHHQGAIDMARVILGFGEDPEIRKLAEEVIAAQKQEIAVLQQWLAKQPKQ